LQTIFGPPLILNVVLNINNGSLQPSGGRFPGVRKFSFPGMDPLLKHTEGPEACGISLSQEFMVDPILKRA